jgi:hypothetical protein
MAIQKGLVPNGILQMHLGITASWMCPLIVLGKTAPTILKVKLVCDTYIVRETLCTLAETTTRDFSV